MYSWIQSKGEESLMGSGVEGLTRRIRSVATIAALRGCDEARCWKTGREL